MRCSHSTLNVRWFGKSINFAVGNSCYIGAITSDLVGDDKSLAAL